MKKTTVNRIALLVLTALCLAALFAACQPQTVTVTFYVGEKSVTREFTAGETITTPEEFEEVGSTVKWYADMEFITAWNNDIKLKRDLTLFGQRVPAEITIAQAKTLCTETESTQRYLIRATVKSIDDASYGAMTITDSTGEISVYGTRGADGNTHYDKLDHKPYAGDEVLLSCTLQLFKEEPEVRIGWILEVKHNEIELNESDYTAMTVAQARAAEKGALVKTSGVVARIIYANGMKPCGFILADSTSSMYVYDSQIAPRVAIGNTVTLYGTKDYYILDSEKNNAQTFGYKGCNQLTKVTMKENDEKTSDFDKTWITETSVKDLMDTPVTEDITALTYKVNALIKKSVGSGFTNYYIDDIDGKTGSYTYTLCTGSDFAWLDEFDGKICTVYLTALNAKSTNSGCNWRFIPVEVKDENYSFDVNKAPDYAIKYVAAEQFKSSYSVAEATTLTDELVTSVSSELLGFENVAPSYETDNNDVIEITIDNGKPYLSLKDFGKATITITATHGQNTATKKIEITVKKTEPADSFTGAQAIASEVGETVAVKGIVGPSLVNQTGFYLIDDSGVIAVVVANADSLEDLQIGNEIVVRGTRPIRKKDPAATTYHGQTNLDACTILSNDYGKHDYSTATFVTGKSVTDLYGTPATDDATTAVYIVTGSVKVVEADRYSNIYIVDGETELRLYCSNASQYNWLKTFDGQTVMLEIALCNWNNKTYYTGCVLAVINEDGTKTVNTLNFKK